MWRRNGWFDLTGFARKRWGYIQLHVKGEGAWGWIQNGGYPVQIWELLIFSEFVFCLYSFLSFEICRCFGGLFLCSTSIS